MPRSQTTRGRLAAEVLANGLIASARNISASPATAKKVDRQAWMNEAWYWYDTIEVFHYGVQWVGNTLSRAKLVVLKDGEPTDDPRALAALEDLFGGMEEHGEFLRQAAVHMTVAGEGYLFAHEEEGKDVWAVVAATEVKKVSESEYKIEGDVYDIGDILLIRIWRPHPRKRRLSDSPTRPLLPILSQIDELTKMVSAQADSRLSGNGLLLMPSEVTFPTQAVAADGQTSQQAGVTGFMREMVETMAAAKADRTSAAARTPLVAMAPGEHLDKFRHLTFWSELDQHAESLRNESIRRLALGMDMPPEALLGTGDVNHWGAWQIEDSLIKSHSEPLLKLITSAVTTSYLRVVLQSSTEDEEGMDEEEANTFSIGSDTTEMRLRPNRSKESLELWDRGLLGNATALRENGFEEADAMDENERKQWILLKLAQGSPDSDLVRQAAEQLGITVSAPAIEGGEARGERPLPRSLEEHPSQDPPEPEAAIRDILAASAEPALFYALSRAGNRIRSTSAKITGVPPEVTAMDRYMYVTLSREQLDFVLDDAWPFLSRIQLPVGVSHERFEAALDNYARVMISNQQPYQREVLGRYLELAVQKK